MNYIWIKESKLKYLTKLDSAQFFKIKSECPREDGFILVQLEETKRTMKHFREYVHKNLELYGLKVPEVPEDQSCCGSILIESLEPTLLTCITCKSIYKYNK